MGADLTTGLSNRQSDQRSAEAATCRPVADPFTTENDPWQRRRWLPLRPRAFHTISPASHSPASHSPASHSPASQKRAFVVCESHKTRFPATPFVASVIWVMRNQQIVPVGSETNDSDLIARFLTTTCFRINSYSLLSPQAPAPSPGIAHRLPAGFPWRKCL